MKQQILLIMPTRGRTWAALEAIASVKKNAVRPDDVLICTCQDTDDPARFKLQDEHGLTGLISTRRRFVDWVNFALSQFDLRQFTHVGWLADDIRYETKGWDDMVHAQPELLVYGDDDIRHEVMPTHPFVRTALPRALGYFLPDDIVHQFPDVFLGDLAREIGSIKYLPELKTRHYHYTTGRAPRDQNYADSEATFAKDKLVYDSTIYPDLPRLAKIYNDYVAHQGG